MTTKTFIVPNISCGHCTATIEKELKFVDGVASVKAEIDSKRVTVDVENEAVFGEVELALNEIGYPAAPTIVLE